MARDQQPDIRGFQGLNNVGDRRRLGLAWLEQADNADVTNKRALARCSGFTRATTNFAITGAYTTNDRQRLFVVDVGELRQMSADLSTYVVLKTGLSPAKMYFAEVNGDVYYANGIDFGVITGGAVKPWGISPPAAPQASLGSGILKAGTYQILCTFVDASGLESGNSPVVVVTAPDNSLINVTSIPTRAGYTTNVYVTTCNGTVFLLLAYAVGASISYNCSPEELGTELRYWNIDAPRGAISAYFAGQMYIAESYPQLDKTAVWTTLPLQFHHFDYGDNGIVVPGTVRMLKACKDALIIGTEREVYAFGGDKLLKIADYGVVPGFHASEHEGQLFFWSLRGLCTAMPFQNLTFDKISVAPGLSAGAMVIEEQGYKRYVVALHKGGTPYNVRTRT